MSNLDQVRDLEEIAKEILSKLKSESMDEMAEVVFVERYLKAAYKWGRERGEREERNRNS